MRLAVSTSTGITGIAIITLVAHITPVTANMSGRGATTGVMGFIVNTEVIASTGVIATTDIVTRTGDTTDTSHGLASPPLRSHKAETRCGHPGNIRT